MTEEDFKKQYSNYLHELSRYINPALYKVIDRLRKEGAEELIVPNLKTQNDARGFVYCLFKERCDQLSDG